MQALPVLLPPTNADLVKAAQNIVCNKYEMDRAVRTSRAMLISNGLWDNDHSPKIALPFLSEIIPFLSMQGHKQDPFFARVPTAQTLGCSWKWSNAHLSEDKAREIIEKLNSDHGQLTATSDPASYIWIKALGLFAPGEGKNRVDFFRENDIATIPARVTELAYPEAERIKLYNVEQGQFSAVWAVLDDRWLQPLKHAAWCLPLLSAYGISLERWPAYMPSPVDVQGALVDENAYVMMRFDSEAAMFHSSTLPTLDLDYLREQKQHSEEEIHYALFDVKTLKIKPAYWRVVGAACVISTVGLAAIGPMQETSPTLQYLAMGLSVLFTAGITATVIPLLKICSIQRRHANHHIYYARKVKVPPRNQRKPASAG